jgi:putative membrane protein
MMYNWNDGWGWGAWLAMGLMMLVVWGSIVAVVVLLVRGTGGIFRAPAPPPGEAGDQALRILDERFARGEIDAEEYRSRRDLLRSR